MSSPPPSQQIDIEPSAYHGPPSLDKIPTKEVPQTHHYFKIHVCQASYGDCLAIEFDHAASYPGSIGLKSLTKKEHTPTNKFPDDEQEKSRDENNDKGKGGGKKRCKGQGQGRGRKKGRGKGKGKGKGESGDRDTNDGDDDRQKEKKRLYERLVLIPDDNTNAQRKFDKTRRVFLIDGGPAHYAQKGRIHATSTPVHNMFQMLNKLLPDEGVNRLDTLVVTHDDADHINGIHQLFLSLINPTEKEDEYAFLRGIRALEDGYAPFANIWHNSVATVLKHNQNGSQNMGWFDHNMFDMTRAYDLKAPPECNAEFGENPITHKRRTINGETVATSSTHRGHLEFKFLSPNSTQALKLEKLFKGGSYTKKRSDGQNLDGYEDPDAMNTGPRAIKKIAAPLGDKKLGDRSVKNQSSIAFIVRGVIANTDSDSDSSSTEEFSAAFTGDGNAAATFLPEWSGTPLKYTVLKVMHHGSQHNNYWAWKDVQNRLGGASSNQACIPDSVMWEKVPAKCKEGAQEDVTLFFTNVLAKTYIISSSISEGHQNPHMSTLVGIITRAIVRYEQEDEGIDIYLTSKAIAHQVYEFCHEYCWRDPNAEPGYEYTSCLDNHGDPQLFWDKEGRYYRIWQLRPGIDPQFGTILVSPKESLESKNLNLNPMWQRVEPTSESYLAFHRGYYSTPMSFQVVDTSMFKKDLMTIDEERIKSIQSSILQQGDDGKDPEPPKKTRGRKPRINQPGGQKRERPKGRLNSGSDMRATRINSNQSSAMVTGEGHLTIASKSKGQDGSKLQELMEILSRFDVKVSPMLHRRPPALLAYQFKHIIDPVSLLYHLALGQSLNAAQVQEFVGQFIKCRKMTLAGLLNLLFQPKDIARFLDLLPITLGLPLEKGALHSHLGPSFEAVVTDYESRRAFAPGNSGVETVSFQVVPPPGQTRWVIPFETYAEDNWSPMIIHIDDHITFRVHWPFDSRRRYVHGTFHGQVFNSSTKSSKVVVDYLYFPDTDEAVHYHVRFTNDAHSVEGHDVSMRDIWNLLPAGTSTVADVAAPILLPGLETKIDDALSLQNCGFVVERSSIASSTVTLKRIFGSFSLKEKKSWTPFGDLIVVKTPLIGLRLENLFSVTPLRVFVRIEEQLEIDGINVPIIFETKRNRGTLGTVYQLSYLARPEEGIALKTLVNWLSLGLANFSNVPGLGQVLENVRISSFTLGWYDARKSHDKQTSFSAKPDFVEIALDIDQMDIVPNVLTVREAWFEMRVDLMSAASKDKIVIAITTTLLIGTCDVEFLVFYGERPEWNDLVDEMPGHFKLVLNSMSKPLSLANILGHFLPATNVLPSYLHTLLTKTGILRLHLSVEKDEIGNNQISSLMVEVGIEVKDVNILDSFKISDPSFILRVQYPNNVAKRRIKSEIRMKVEICDVMMEAIAILDIEEETTIGFAVLPAQSRLPLGKFIRFLAEKGAKNIRLDLPKDLASFVDIDCGPISLTFNKRRDGDFQLATCYLDIQSSMNLTLWTSPKIAFSEIGLIVQYAREVETSIVFTVALEIGSSNFLGTLEYCSSSNTSLTDGTSVPALGSLDKRALKTWTASVGHHGTIALQSVLCSLTGVDFLQLLDSTGLHVLRKLFDIRITDAKISLTKSSETEKIQVSAQLEWLSFTSVEVSASRLPSLSLTLCLSCKDGPLKLIPGAESASKYLTFGDTTVYLFYGSVDFTNLGQGLMLNKKSMDNLKSSGGIMIATSISFNLEHAEPLATWIKRGELRVFGAAGPNFFFLGIRIGQLTLLKERLKITADFFLAYVKSKLEIGVEGAFTLQVDAISKSLIEGSVVVSLDLRAAGVEFAFTTTTTLCNLFEIDGFDLEAIGISLTVNATLTPSKFEIAGGAKLRGLANVSGRIFAGFDATNPSNCYLRGSLERLNLVTLLARFASNLELPPRIVAFLSDSGVDFKKLAIELALKDTKDVTGLREIKQGFHFEGAVSLVAFAKPFWAGYALIDIRKSSFALIALMEPIILFPITPTIFSLVRHKTDTLNGYGLHLPNVDMGGLTNTMLEEGPVMKIIPGDKSENPVFISASLVFLGSDPQYFYARYNKGKGFTGSFGFGDSSSARVTAAVTCDPRSQISIVASLTLSIPSVVLNLACRLNSVLGAFPADELSKSTESAVGINGIMNLYGGWVPGKLGFGVDFSASAFVYGRTWDLGSIGVHVTESDLCSLAALLKRTASIVQSKFSEILNDWIRRAETILEEAIALLHKRWEATSVEVVRIMVSVKNSPVFQTLLATVSTLHIPLGEAIKLFTTFGLSIWQAIRSFGMRAQPINIIQTDSLADGSPLQDELPFDLSVRKALQQVYAAMNATRTDEDVLLIDTQPLPEWYVQEMLHSMGEKTKTTELESKVKDNTSEDYGMSGREGEESLPHVDTFENKRDREECLQRETRSFTEKELACMVKCLLVAGYDETEVELILKTETMELSRG